MDQNWDDLRLFLAVAREQSLSAAGKLLRLDPATLGRRMARLEKSLQTVLFVKSPQGYALTEAGSDLMQRAAKVEQAMRAASAGVPVQSDRLSGQIRVGAPDGAANYLLPQVCAGIAAQNPDLDVQIIALPRVFNLSRREADMAIGVSAPTAGRLVVQKVTDYKLHLAAADSYLARHSPVRSTADLAGHRIVGYIPDMIFDRELDYLADLGVNRVALASNSVSVQVRMIQQGGGIGVAHDFSLPATPGVRRILPDQVSLTRAFYLIRHVDDRRNARLSGFAEALAVGLRAETMRLEALAAEQAAPKA
ncbi:LysR family transcriptional regulator [Sulfitobacter sp. W027]|uniref:LysR family transcriptional regulator n=1 Tax=Sulfitobacter sp. W027 TaxID=2867025 RepID=UPI0021A69D85|nr:LysR family transcriptional regulator [Sulfitobacter sp. W027]UWR32107.1 LysR family transcriptional regulator [Sulfitobacter sp. W027]